MVTRKLFNESQLSIDSTLNAGAAQDSATKRKPSRAKVEFNHEALRKAMLKARKFLKLNLTYAAEACGMNSDRLRILERGYDTRRPELILKFNVHEVLSICLAYDLDIWNFTVMPVQLSIIEGSSAERRDRAWAECQSAWQQNAELRQLLKMALEHKLPMLSRKRAQELCKTPPAGTVGIS